MGWFGKSTTEEQPDLITKKDRKKCWESRDAYYSCLDKSGVLKPGEEGSSCKKELVEYEKSCAKSWVCAPFVWNAQALTLLTVD